MKVADEFTQCLCLHEKTFLFSSKDKREHKMSSSNQQKILLLGPWQYCQYISTRRGKLRLIAAIGRMIRDLQTLGRCGNFYNLLDTPLMGRFPCCNFLTIDMLPNKINQIPTTTRNQTL